MFLFSFIYQTVFARKEKNTMGKYFMADILGIFFYSYIVAFSCLSQVTIIYTAIFTMQIVKAALQY